MKLIVGLGNPGTRYAGTRHNAGRRLVEYIAGKHSLKPVKKKPLHASLVSFEWENHPVILAWPETFMNVSGEAVGALVRHFDLDPAKDLLVAVDDTALPFGKFRLRARGSDGGHHGLASVQGVLGTAHYARLRFGIGSPVKPLLTLEDYVLSPFNKEEAKAMGRVLEKGSEACRLWTTQTAAAAMNAVNPC